MTPWSPSASASRSAESVGGATIGCTALVLLGAYLTSRRERGLDLPQPEAVN